MQFCQDCGRRRKGGEWSCPACRGTDYGAGLPPGVLPRAQSGDEQDGRPLLGPLERMKVPDGQTVFAWSIEGLGKSTMLYAGLRKPLIVTIEQPPNLVARYLQRLETSHSGIVYIEHPNDADGYPTVPLHALPSDGDGVDVMVDSISAYHHNALPALLLWRRYAERSGARVFLIGQANAEGKALGERALRHYTDAVIELRKLDPTRRRILLTKTRFQPLTSWVWDLQHPKRGPSAQTEALIQVRRYFSIEGAPWAYHLQPFPPRNRRSPPQLADVLTLADKHGGQVPLQGEVTVRLPPPPLAVTAQRSTLYGSGWVEPDDVDDRRAFAAQAGIPWWSPTTPDTAPTTAIPSPPPEDSASPTP